jgi:hypothetical protein
VDIGRERTGMDALSEPIGKKTCAQYIESHNPLMRFGAFIMFPHFSAQLGDVGIQAPSLV